MNQEQYECMGSITIIIDVDFRPIGSDGVPFMFPDPETADEWIDGRRLNLPKCCVSMWVDVFRRVAFPLPRNGDKIADVDFPRPYQAVRYVDPKCSIMEYFEPSPDDRTPIYFATSSYAKSDLANEAFGREYAALFDSPIERSLFSGVNFATAASVSTVDNSPEAMKEAIELAAKIKPAPKAIGILMDGELAGMPAFENMFRPLEFDWGNSKNDRLDAFRYAMSMPLFTVPRYPSTMLYNPCESPRPKPVEPKARPGAGAILAIAAATIAAFFCMMIN